MQQFEQMLEWRTNNKVDDVLQTFTPPEVFNKYFSLAHVSKDKIGCPRNLISIIIFYSFFSLNIILFLSIVWISSFGRNDFKGIASSMSKKDIQRNIQHLLEQMALAIRAEKSRNTSRQLMVFDMEDLSLKQITNKSGFYFSKIYLVN